MSRADIARAGAERGAHDAELYQELAVAWYGYARNEKSDAAARAISDIAETYNRLNAEMGALQRHFERLAEAVDGEEDDNLKAEGVDS